MAGVTVRPTTQHYIPSGVSQYIIQNDNSASLTVLAGVPGQVIDVWGFLLSSAGTTGIDLKSNATSMTGSFAMINGYPFYVDVPSGTPGPGGDRAFPVCTTADGESLNLTNSATQVISGIIWLVQRPTNTN